MRPETESELAELVTGLEHPVRIVGGGTRGVAGVEPELNTTGLDGVTLYEPGALTLVARAGTPVAEIEAVLSAEGQQLAFEPMDHRGVLGTSGAPTIGGVVAANISGPRRILAGACRDFLLGVRFVDGRGQIVSNGGRVMKNVTGYDLVKLMAGSWGTLGVLTEVSLKVLPMPETQATLSVALPDAGAAVRLLSAALKTPFEVSGAAYDPVQGKAFVRVEGFEDSVAYRTRGLTEALKGFGTVLLEDNPVEIWTAIRDLHAFYGKDGDLWRVSVKPGNAPAVIAKAGADQALLDWGGGLVWLRVPEGTDLRLRLGSVSGHATRVRASSETLTEDGRFPQLNDTISALTQGIRRQFDPRSLFNSGLMG